VDIKASERRQPVRLALALLDLYVPGPVRRRVLRELFAATAQAFGVDPPPVRGLSARRLLHAYALFTKEESERLWAEKRDQGAVEGCLFQKASELGTKLRRKLVPRNAGDVMRLSRVLYRILGISFSGRPDGRVVIRDCYFSRFYTGRVCRLVSALDAGAASGLSGGGKLEFSQRMTEGHDRCLARLVFKEDPS
jgi:hypothetical protein